MQVAIVDTGIDYTHASFGGAGTVEAYEANNPTFIETDSFPTEKVIGGFDFVGENYDVLDAESSNDVPRPDFDPLDEDGHGTHTGSTVAGIEVPGQVGSASRPRPSCTPTRCGTWGTPRTTCWSPPTSERSTPTRTATCRTPWTSCPSPVAFPTAR